MRRKNNEEIVVYLQVNTFARQNILQVKNQQITYKH